MKATSVPPSLKQAQAAKKGAPNGNLDVGSAPKPRACMRITKLIRAPLQAEKAKPGFQGVMKMLRDGTPYPLDPNLYRRDVTMCAESKEDMAFWLDALGEDEYCGVSGHSPDGVSGTFRADKCKEQRKNSRKRVKKLAELPWPQRSMVGYVTTRSVMIGEGGVVTGG